MDEDEIQFINTWSTDSIDYVKYYTRAVEDLPNEDSEEL